jgi:hypothetical protein
MALMLAGFVVFVVTGAIFWMLLPRGEQRHRFVDTEAEPYISVALCAGVALSFTMILSGVLSVLGAS